MVLRLHRTENWAYMQYVTKILQLRRNEKSQRVNAKLLVNNYRVLWLELKQTAQFHFAKY